jgi:hypothetical protein
MLSQHLKHVPILRDGEHGVDAASIILRRAGIAGADARGQDRGDDVSIFHGEGSLAGCLAATSESVIPKLSDFADGKP